MRVCWSSPDPQQAQPVGPKVQVRVQEGLGREQGLEGMRMGLQMAQQVSNSSLTGEQEAVPRMD